MFCFTSKDVACDAIYLVPVIALMIEYKIISTVIRLSSLLLIHSGSVVVRYKRKNVHKVLVNNLFNLAQEKNGGKVN